MISSLIRSLALTLLLELTLGWLLGLRRGREMTVVVLMNFLTNPPLVFLSGMARKLLPPGHCLFLTIFLELAAFLLEALILRGELDLPLKRAAKISAALNLGSYWSGYWIHLL